MKRIIITIILCMSLSGTAHAYFTVNYSGSKTMIAPMLSTSGVSGAEVEDFTIASTSSSTVLTGTLSGSQTVRDVVEYAYSPALVLAGCIVNVSDYTGGFLSATYTAVNPSIAAIDSSGNARYVSNGLAHFNAQIGSRIKQVSCPMSLTGGQMSTSFIHFAPGSLATYLTDQMAATVNGLTPSATTENILNYANDSGHSWQRNSSIQFLGHNMDLTAIPIWSDWDDTNPYGGARFNGILITSDIVATASHTRRYGGYDPHLFYFLDNNNNVITDAVLSYAGVTNSDITLYRLADKLPPSITPASVFATSTLQPASPTDYIHKFSVSTSTNEIAINQIPVFFTNQFRTIKIGGFCGTGRGGACIRKNASSSLISWYDVPISGDSGSPQWMVVNRKTVAIGTWTSPSGGSDLAFYGTTSPEFGNLQATITGLGSDTMLNIADVSGFPVY